MRLRFRGRAGDRCPRCHGTRTVHEPRIGHDAACPTCLGAGSIGPFTWPTAAAQSEVANRLIPFAPQTGR